MALQMGHSAAASIHLLGRETNPATSLANAQPTAAPDSATLAAAAPPQLGPSNSAEPALQEPDTAAGLVHTSSSGQESAVPADSSGILTSPAHCSQDVQHQATAVQPGKGIDPLAAVGVQHVAEPVRGLADPNKRLLAKMGSQAPADVSKQLMQQVAARSHVEALLQVSRPTWPLVDVVMIA